MLARLGLSPHFPRRPPPPSTIACLFSARLVRRSYRAPEVIVGLPYGAKVDVVSEPALLGVLVSSLHESILIILVLVGGAGLG